MAQKLLETYHIPYFSIDHLKMGIFKTNPDCGFLPTDDNDHIGEILWPILEKMIITIIENKQHMIVEGCYFLPHLVKKLEAAYPAEVISVFLGFSNRYIQNNFETKILANREIIESRGLEDREMQQFIKEHTLFRQICLQEKVHYFEIDQDYETEIADVYRYIQQSATER